ncbi:MAG: class I SAM-dependent methyltransferase [Fimbriimonadaceae bacterium]
MAEPSLQSMNKNPPHVQVDVPATDENFDAKAYLAGNPDVDRAVRSGQIASARAHYDVFGKEEGRRLRKSSDIAPLRAFKLQELHDKLCLELPHVRCGDKFDFLTDELRAECAISSTDAVSANSYDGYVIDLINRHANGCVLDVGAGMRDVYYQNVINYEIVDYDTTDVVGVGEKLPFKNSCFDGIISIAVMEHVRDPFQCAREIVRVLKPGGQLVCAVPFLQPLHGYPHHYYNMTQQGLRALFERDLDITAQFVSPSLLPIWSLTWILRSWSLGLTGASKTEFLEMKVADLIDPPERYLARSFVRDLTNEKNFELASGTMLLASKPG